MMRSRRGLWGILLTLAVLFSPLQMEKAEGQAPLREDPDKVIGFAHHLLSEGDSYRAITEYQAFLFLFAHDPRVWEARYFLAKAYREEGQWDEALNTFHQVAQDAPQDSPWASEAALEVGETLLKSGHPASAARSLEEVARTPRWERMRGRALYRAAWSWLQARKWGEAIRVLEAMKPADPLAGKAEDLKNEVLKGVPNLPRRSPWVAGGLAAILPGSGHLYIGRPKEAVSSFLLNGAFIAGSSWAIQEGYPVTGGILAFFELGWYLGGISTASKGASRFNRSQETLWLGKLEERWGLPMVEAPTSSAGTLWWSIRF